MYFAVLNPFAAPEAFINPLSVRNPPKFMATALHCPKIASPKIKHPKKAFISVQSPDEN